MAKFFLSLTDGIPEKLTKFLGKEQKDGGEVNFIDIPDSWLEDPTPLRNSLDHVRVERDAARTQAKTLQDQVAALSSGDAEKRVKDLDASYKGILTKKDEEHKTLLTQKDELINNLTVGVELERLCTDLSDSPALLRPHIQNRLKAEQVEGNVVIRVLSEKGEVTANTVDDLKKEVLANPLFAPIVVASRGSGSGAGAGRGKGSGGAKKFSDMTEKEKVELKRSDAVKYRALRDAEKPAE